MIFLHGGGWWGGDKTDLANPRFNAPLHAAELGWVAFNIDYRLAPNTFARGRGDSARPYVDQPRDVASAILWVKRHAKVYSVDPNRIALIGASAGAHLALLTGFSHSAPRDPVRVKVIVSWAGPTDMAALANEHPCLKNLDGTCNPIADPAGPPIAEMIRRFEGGCTVNQCPARYMDTSPVNKVTAKAPATLLVQGIFDSTVPAEQAAELQAELSAHGVPVQVAGCALVDANGVPLPCNHFTLAWSVWQPTIKFLRRQL